MLLISLSCFHRISLTDGTIDYSSLTSNASSLRDQKVHVHISSSTASSRPTEVLLLRIFLRFGGMVDVAIIDYTHQAVSNKLLASFYSTHTYRLLFILFRTSIRMLQMPLLHLIPLKPRYKSLHSAQR